MMRVFVGPLEVAGIGHYLVAGLRENGVEAEQVLAYPHRFAYAPDAVKRGPAAWWYRLGTWRAQLAGGSRVARVVVVALQWLVGWLVLAWALRRFDAFVFLYGESITNTALEAALLRAAGKRTLVVFVGSDARPPYIDGGRFPADIPFDAAAATRAAARQRRRVRRIERGASVVVNERTTAHFQTRPFVNWFALGIPRPADPAPPPPVDGAVRVLHSPSRPVLKGTAHIVSVVDALRARGVPVELVQLQGRSNAEVLQALRACHLAVDQLYSDTPMAAFATEAASLARPVIVCGCAADRAITQVAPAPLPPSLYVRPEALESTLEVLVRDAARRESAGAAGAAFVATHWSPVAVAARALRMLRGDIPTEWWCDPAEVDHVTGCGLPEAVARAHVAAVIRAGGVAALQLSDKPALEHAFVCFAAVAEESP
jgi:hypothetical protein